MSVQFRLLSNQNLGRQVPFYGNDCALDFKAFDLVCLSYCG